jgi:hypothetical protein
MSSLRSIVKSWIQSHPKLYSIYKQNKFRIFSSFCRDLPDFAIIGAQKSGTTSLYDFIIKHPCVVSAYRKEMHYFSSLFDFGELWYRSNFPTKLYKYYFKKKFDKQLLCGDATPYYLLHPLVPMRMKRSLPKIKIIVILRNPVDRAYSHYHFALRHKHETLSFEDAINQEEKRLAGERKKIIQDPSFDGYHFKRNSYLTRGVYVDQLKHWFEYYDKNQFLILTTEDLYANPQKILNQVFQFLNLNSYEIKDLKNLNVGNYKNMNNETRKTLIEYFRPYNCKLSKLLDRDFDWDK